MVEVEAVVRPITDTFVPVILKLNAERTPLAALVGQQVSRYQHRSGLGDQEFIDRAFTALGLERRLEKDGMEVLGFSDSVTYLHRVKAGQLVPGADFVMACAIVAGLSTNLFDEIHDRISELETAK